MKIGRSLELLQVEKTLIYLLLLFLPTQLGKHYWPDFAIVTGMRVDYLSPTIYFTDLIIVLLFGVVVANYILNRRNKSVKAHDLSKIAIILYICFITYLLLNIAISGNAMNGLYHVFKFLEFSFVAYIFATRTVKLITFRGIAKVLAFGVIGESLIAFLQYMQQGSIGGLLYFLGERTFNASTPGIANASINGELILRSYGTFSHPNVLAGYLVVSMILIVGWLLPSKNMKEKILTYGSLFMGSMALVLTFSRVAIALWVLLLIAAALQGIYKQIRSKKLTQVISKRIMLLSVIILIAGASMFHPLSYRFLQTTFSEEAVVQRQLLNEIAIKMFREHPYTGIGIGNFLPELATLPSASVYGIYLQPVHNIFLLTAAETGIIGVVFFLIFLGVLMYRLAKNKSWLLLTILSVIILLGLNDHYWLTLQQGQLLLAVVLGLCKTSGKKTFHLGAAKNIRM